MGQGKTAWLAQITAAVVIALLVGGTAPWWWTELFGGKAPRPASPTPPPAAVKYVVTERNPFSGGVESAREFAQADHPAFTRYCTELRKAHWVSWRYIGINEPLRSRRFPDSPGGTAVHRRPGPTEPGRRTGLHRAGRGGGDRRRAGRL